MKAIYTLIIILIPFIGFGQGWENTFPNSSGFSVKQSIDGGYVITGNINADYSYSTDNYNGNVYILKTDEIGNEESYRIYGEGEENLAYSIQLTNDGGYIITGYQIDDEGMGISLLKTDSNIDEDWTKIISYGIGRSVQQTSDNGFIISGISDSIGGDVLTGCLIKTDEDGNVEWKKVFSGSQMTSDPEYIYSVQQTIDGGFISTGYSFGETNTISESSSLRNNYSIGLAVHLRLIKTDVNGNVEWEKKLTDGYNSIGYSVKQTIDGGYVVTGTKDSKVLLMKTDQNGEEQWISTFGDANLYSVGYSVQQTNDGGFILSGERENEDYDRLVWLIKTNENGNGQWDRTFGNGNINIGRSVQQTSDGGYVICGQEYDNDSNASNILLIKTNSFGNITSTIEIPLPNADRKAEKTINLKGQEIKPKPNNPIVEIYDDGTVEKKVIIE